MSTIKRSSNFSREEVHLLVDGVLEFQQPLFHKQTNTFTNQLKRHKWIEINERLGAVSSQVRTLEQIRKKWKDLASLTKKKAARVRAEARKTGGGSCPEPLSELELKIVSVIGESCVDGVQDGYDSHGLTCDETNQTENSIEQVEDEVPISPAATLWDVDITNLMSGDFLTLPCVNMQPAVTGDGVENAEEPVPGTSAEAAIPEMIPTGRSKPNESTPKKRKLTRDEFDEEFLNIEKEKLKTQKEISTTLIKILYCLQSKNQ